MSPLQRKLLFLVDHLLEALFWTLPIAQIVIAFMMWVLPENPGKWRPPAVALAIAPITLAAVVFCRRVIPPNWGLSRQ